MTLEAGLLRYVVNSAKELMRHESIILFKDICQMQFAVVDMTQEELDDWQT